MRADEGNSTQGFRGHVHPAGSGRWVGGVLPRAQNHVFNVCLAIHVRSDQRSNSLGECIAAASTMAFRFQTASMGVVVCSCVSASARVACGVSRHQPQPVRCGSDETWFGEAGRIRQSSPRPDARCSLNKAITDTATDTTSFMTLPSVPEP